jgi:hypothetical protein
MCPLLLLVPSVESEDGWLNSLSYFKESAICTRVLSYTLALEPINKAYIVSILEGGSGRTRRLARWIAHAIITDKRTVAAVCIIHSYQYQT